MLMSISVLHRMMYERENVRLACLHYERQKLFTLKICLLQIECKQFCTYFLITEMKSRDKTKPCRICLIPCTTNLFFCQIRKKY